MNLSFFKIAILIVFLIAVAGVALFIQKPRDKPDELTRLKQAMRAADAARSGHWFGANADYTVSNAYTAMLNQTVLDHDKNPELVGNVETEVDQISVAYASSEVNDAAQAFFRKVLADNQKAEVAYATGAEALVARASVEIPQAKTPSDLDGLLADMKKTATTGANGMVSERVRCVTQEISEATDFIKTWQDYLYSSAHGQKDAAVSDLRTLANVGYSYEVIPRSITLDRMADLDRQFEAEQEKRPESIVIFQGIKSLNDMEPALQQMKGAKDASARNTQLLEGYLEDYNAVKAGETRTIDLGGEQYIQVYGNPGLASQLLLFFLQHYFVSYRGNPPADGEHIEDYLGRVIDDSERRSDWPLLRQAVAVANFWTQSSYFDQTSQADLEGLDSIGAALNQEDAGQFALAVFSWQKALMTRGAYVPAKMIGARLSALQKDHPDDFKSGMQLTLSFALSGQRPPTQGVPAAASHFRIVIPGTTPAVSAPKE